MRNAAKLAHLCVSIVATVPLFAHSRPSLTQWPHQRAGESEIVSLSMLSVYSSPSRSTTTTTCAVCSCACAFLNSSQKVGKREDGQSAAAARGRVGTETSLPVRWNQLENWVEFASQLTRLYGCGRGGWERRPLVFTARSPQVDTNK